LLQVSAEIFHFVPGRSTFYGDGASNFDFGLFKTFRLPFEQHQLTLRANLFNAFNHAQFAFPTLDLASTAFGRITGTAVQYSPRNVQSQASHK